jgi:hypothetical protein
MRPLRRTILQFSQIRLTLERTFMTGPIVTKAQHQWGETLDARGRSLPSHRAAIQPGTVEPPRSIALIEHASADTPSGPRTWPAEESRDYMQIADPTTS